MGINIVGSYVVGSYTVTPIHNNTDLYAIGYTNEYTRERHTNTKSFDDLCSKFAEANSIDWRHFYTTVNNNNNNNNIINKIHDNQLIGPPLSILHNLI